VLIGETIADVGVEVAAFGVGTEELLVASRGDVEKSVAFAGAKLNVEQKSTRIMAGGS
jgi:hypothetical protein